MKTFKQFLDEAPRKPKEVPFHDADYSSGYSQLRDMQNSLSMNVSHFRLQLFVPKRRDPAKIEKYKRDHAWREIKKQFPDEIVKEESIPVLTSFKESPVDGDNKPSGAFWTSSAIKKPDGSYSSDWVQHVSRVLPEWQTDYGYLFEIKPQALILDSGHLDQFYHWAESHGKMTKELSDYAKNSDSETRMRSNFPWSALAKHFDGVHHDGYGSHYGRDFTYGWDVESTAWFNTSWLTYKGAVRIWDGNSDEDD
jgi:hypothetical protein